MSFVTYVPVVEATEIAAGTMRKVDFDGRSIVVAKVEGAYFAFRPDCPHSGTNLALGSLDGKVVECPNHHFRFDLKTGKLIDPIGGCPDMAVFTIEERDGMLCLKLEI